MKIASVRQYALSLPEVTEEPHFNFASFRVRGKIFVTVPPEEKFIHVFVGDEHREPAMAMHPEFIEKLMWGAKAIGVRINLSKAQPAVVRELISQAWRTKAPKGLHEKPRSG